jgi:hypothetical protein
MKGEKDEDEKKTILEEKVVLGTFGQPHISDYTYGGPIPHSFLEFAGIILHYYCTMTKT